ncbi:MAG: TIGR02444 family protein [Gammaproteobacteria bacterium]|nr:TIGR02444 family protein [Gammaproteobacteria bacterium]
MNLRTTMSEGFWDFSNRIYRKRDVSQCCLSLQNLYGLDVNLLLFACWHARSRGLFDIALVEKALTFSSAWADHVVKPLRGARRWMKAQMENSKAPHEEVLAEEVLAEEVLVEDFHRLREQIKALELQCEKFQEHTLESMVSGRELLLSVEMQIAAAVYNLHCVLLSTFNSEQLPRPLPLHDFLTTLILNALDQDPDDNLLHQAISRELNAQSLGRPGVRICESLPSA